MDNKIFNTTTKRYVNRDGKIGRKIIERQTKMWKDLFLSDIFTYVVLLFFDEEDITNLLCVSKDIHNSIKKYAVSLYRRTYSLTITSSDALCWLLNYDKKITKTMAKIKYRLSNAILDNIEYEEKFFYFYGVVGRLYKLKDIISTAIIIHGTLSHLRERHEEKKMKIRERQEKCEERKQKLIDELAKVKLKLRSDSQLCEKYIDGKEPNLQYVVKRMCEMKYLFEYFPFKQYVNKVRNEFGYIHGPIHEFIERKYVTYPTEWPWLVNKK